MTGIGNVNAPPSNKALSANGAPSCLRGIPTKQAHVSILNAAASVEGRQFAFRNADFLFTPVFDYEQGTSTVDEVSAAVRAVGRDVGVFTFCTVVCRPTQKEAEEYWDYYANEHADWGAVDYLMKLQGLHAQSFMPEALANFRDRFAAGHGGYPLVGTPDQIADKLEKLSTTGLTGTTLAFVNYAKEFPYFCDEVLPRLEKRLAKPIQALVSVLDVDRAEILNWLWYNPALFWKLTT